MERSMEKSLMPQQKITFSSRDRERLELKNIYRLNYEKRSLNQGKKNLPPLTKFIQISQNPEI